jgi:hypothetical protein
MSGQDLVPNEHTHALHGMTIDLTDDGPVGDPAAAAAIDLTADSSSEEEEEEDTLAQRVKRRKGREQRHQYAGAYQDEATQQQLATEEMSRMGLLVEVRAVPGMGQGHHGLFAVRNLAKGQLVLSYFGKHYASESLYDEAFPNDDGGYVMAHRGEYFDGEGIEQLGKYVNHNRARRNLEFVDDEDSPFVQLRLTKAVRAGQELFTDYGDKYPYEAHGFTR